MVIVFFSCRDVITKLRDCVLRRKSIFMFSDGLLYTYLVEHFNIKTPGLGILIIFVFLVLLGMIGETILARPVKRIINRILTKTPFLKLIYSCLLYTSD